MLTKPEQAVATDWDQSQFCLEGNLLFFSGKLRQEPSFEVTSAYNREKLMITALLREQVGFQHSLHGELRVPRVRKGHAFMQAILAAITNDPHHFSNLRQVFFSL